MIVGKMPTGLQTEKATEGLCFKSREVTFAVYYGY